MLAIYLLRCICYLYLYNRDDNDDDETMYGTTERIGTPGLFNLV